MKSKEEILNNHVSKPFVRNRIAALKAMDEWAKQEAIAFDEWKVREGYKSSIGRDKSVYYSKGGITQFYTTEQLYNLFQESKKQKV